jgi:hypothetical protein
MFNDFLDVLKENHFIETPVDVKTFVQSPEYLGQPLLSDIQYEIVEAMSQIYRKEDLIDLLISIQKMNLFFNLARVVEKILFQQ